MEDGTPPGNEDDPPNHQPDRGKAAEDKSKDTESIDTDARKIESVGDKNHIPAHSPNIRDQLPSSPNARKYHLMYDNMRERYTTLKAKYDEEKAENERIHTEKDRINKELNDCLQAANNRLGESRPALMKMNNEDIFIIKPKKNTKNPTKPSSETCAISGCENTNVDLIKCNMCGNPICEDCSAVKFTKLRPIMNQCSTLYFTCKCCDVLMREKDVDVYDHMKSQINTLKEELESCERQNEKLADNANASQRTQETCNRLTDENKIQADKLEELEKSIAQKTRQHSGCKGEINNLKQKVKTVTDHQESLRLLLEERENSLQETEAKLVSLEQNATTTSQPSNGEVNIEDLINTRFDKIDRNIDALIEKKLAESTTATQPPDNNKLFSAIVGASPTVPTNVTTTRNAELIEKQEQERRATNIIIYGFNEKRDDNVSIQDHDKDLMNSFLQTIEVDVIPKQILRLGRETAGKTRPLKVVMKNSEEKDKIMSSLNKLKNADESLRGISVRDDYTIEERNLIKTMTEEAKRKNEVENVTHWKVRGTPKNGLKVVKITTRK